MSPFKVIRCRYYTEDGKAVPPYCSAGRHCTFLHPNDKGWPGGDPLPDIEKRSEERERGFDRSRPRVSKAVDRISSISHERRSSRGGSGATSMLDLCASEDLHPRKNGSYSSKDISLPVNSIVQSFHDIAKFQIKLTRDREALDKATEKLTSFRELSKSLSKVSATSAAVVAPTLDAIVNARQDLQMKVDEDTKRISDSWDGVFDVFLRAICRQFDNELESGTDYLRQEARILIKSFSKNPSSYRHPEESTLPRSSSSRSHPKSHAIDPRADIGDADKYSKEPTFSESRIEENTAVINPPVGMSDNGWGRKRRRVSSASQDRDGLHAQDAAQSMGLGDVVAELQKRLEEQDEKINDLAKRNEGLESIVRHSSNFTGTNKFDHSHGPPLPVSDALLSQIRITLREDVLAFVSPAIEEQTRLNESWETRISSLSAKLQEMNMERRAIEEDISMEPPGDNVANHEHDHIAI